MSDRVAILKEMLAKEEGEAETVTVPRAELEALRAGTSQPGATPGQAYVQQQQQAADQAAAARLPEGIMSPEEMEAHENQPPPKSWTEQKAQLEEGERYVKSAHWHAEQGR